MFFVLFDTGGPPARPAGKEAPFIHDSGNAHGTDTVEPGKYLEYLYYSLSTGSLVQP